MQTPASPAPYGLGMYPSTQRLADAGFARGEHIFYFRFTLSKQAFFASASKGGGILWLLLPLDGLPPIRMADKCDLPYNEFRDFVILWLLLFLFFDAAEGGIFIDMKD
jgi:hypothetical protein